MDLIKKIELKLQELGILKMAEDVNVPVSGDTKTANTGNIVKAVTWSEIGEPVFCGEEKVADGIYTLDNNIKITVIKGVLAEVVNVTPTQEEKVEKVEEVKEESKEETKVELAASVEKQRIEDLIDLNIDAAYTIEFNVYKGVLTWGALYTETYKDLLMSEQSKVDVKLSELTNAYDLKLSEQKNSYENIITALKSNVKDNVNHNPVSNETPVKLSKVEAIKAQLRK